MQWSLTLVTSSVVIFVAVVYGTIIPMSIKLQKEVDHADEKGMSDCPFQLGKVKRSGALETYYCSLPRAPSSRNMSVETCLWSSAPQASPSLLC